MKVEVFKKEVIPAILAAFISLFAYKFVGKMTTNLFTNDFVRLLVNQIAFSIFALIATIVLKKMKIFNVNWSLLKQGWTSALFLIIYLGVIAGFTIFAKTPIVVKPWEVLCFLLQMFLIGFSEEVLFRGLIQNAFHSFFKEDTRLHVFLAILCTGLVFGFAHIFNGLDPKVGFGASLKQGFGTIFMGMYFSTIYYRTGKNLWFLMILHAVYDLVVSVMSGRLSGSNMEDVLALAQSIDIRTLLVQGAIFLFIIVILIRSKKMDTLLKKDTEVIEG